MTPIHLANVCLHIAAGSAALGTGFYILCKRKGTAHHRYWGKVFGLFALLVCISATIGSIFFRFIPLFAILTVLVTYQLLSGWRSIYTREKGPSLLDGALTIVAALISIAVLAKSLSISNSNNIVIYSSLGAIAFILLYDTTRWIFPRPWFSRIWRFDHTFKLVSSVFAMLSAFIGNVVRAGQPWSQIAPSVLGLIFIIYFFFRLSKQVTPISNTVRNGA